MKMSLRSLLDPFLPSGPSPAPPTSDTPTSSTPTSPPPAHDSAPHDSPGQHSGSSTSASPPASSANPPPAQAQPSSTNNQPSPSSGPGPEPVSSPPSQSKANNHNEQSNESTTKQPSPNANSNPSPNPNSAPNAAEPTSQASSPSPSNDSSSASDKSKVKHSKTIMASSATEVVGVSTATDGKIHTYTSTSYKPYSTVIADAEEDDIPASPSSAPSSAVAGGVIGGLLLLGILGLCAFFVMKRRKRTRRMNHGSASKDMDDLMQYRSPVPTSATATPVMAETPRIMAAGVPYEHDVYQGYQQQVSQQQQQGYYYQSQQDPNYGYDTRMLTAAYAVDQQQQQSPQPITLSDPAGPTPGGGTSVYRTPSYNYHQQQQQQQYMDYSGSANYYQPYPVHQPASDGGYYQPHLVQTDVPHTKD
ncbi:hypothetical protein BX666DRAFT_1256544 [Dichotomocladium elegans]|nr:hypothetical protein BX666DRAFT_1256544 [Dichotomocladium elegans]